MKRGILILIFLLIFCVLGFLILKRTQCNLSTLKYKDYIALLASFASIFVALVFILEYCGIQKSEKILQQRSFVDDARDYWFQNETNLVSDPDLYPLYTELHSNHPDLLPALRNKDMKQFKEIQNISLILSQIENMLLFHGGPEAMKDDPENPRTEQQIRVWRRFFQSPKFRYHYQYLQDNLGRDTNQFIRECLLPSCEKVSGMGSKI